jgi:hypothetical protein
MEDVVSMRAAFGGQGFFSAVFKEGKESGGVPVRVTGHQPAYRQP